MPCLGTSISLTPPDQQSHYQHSTHTSRYLGYPTDTVPGSCRYKPRLGDALLFWGVHPDGELDPRSMHGGCPVGVGRHTFWITR